VVACAKKTIEYYAVVNDKQDGGNVSQVFADVYHPDGSPEPYGPSRVGGVIPTPYFKYEITFADLQGGAYPITKAEAAAIVNLANSHGLITFDPLRPIGDVLNELDKGIAHLWKGSKTIDYEQPAGDYNVWVFAVDQNNNLSAKLANKFTYVAVAGIEVDFTKIDFGSVNLGVEAMIPGDTSWNQEPDINGATVRNVGNTFTSLEITFDDMGLGQDADGKWNVVFDARMGSNDAYYIGNIQPYVPTTLVNALNLSSKDELDLSIKVMKGSGTYSGEITVGAVQRAFDYAYVGGVHSLPEDCPD
jgi:hypothetical protein